MARHFSTGVAVAVILAGGVALAQSDLIVDPWQRVLAGRAAPAVPAAVDAPRNVQRADSGWFDREASRPVVEPGLPVAQEDPWAPRPAVVPVGPVPAQAGAQPPRPLHASDWARVLPDVINPWGPGKLAAYRDPLIVDPWPSSSN